MARKSSSTISQEELYPQPNQLTRDELDDARLLDLDVEEESPFLRGQKRVSVRRGTLAKHTARRLSWGAVALTVLLLCAIAAAALYQYGEHSWRFRIESSDNIEISGLGNVTRAQVMEVMGGDIGRNIFFVPLDQRQQQLEQIAWVKSASVMRFVPNRLKIEIQERTPEAFARVGSRIFLIDADGMLMELPVFGRKKFSFPVILGMNLAEPQSTRAARMKIYNQLLSQLDSGGAHYSQDLSEVDLSDPDDVKILANDPGGEVLVHLGSSDFLDRFKIYTSHVREWRQQFSRLDSVDLRYEHQIIVNPDLQGMVKQPPLALSVAKAAAAAGVKPAALVSHEVPAGKAGAGAPSGTSAALKLATTSVAAKKKPARKRHAKLPIKKAAQKTRVTPDPASATAMKSRLPQTAMQKTVSVGGNAAKSGDKPSPAIPKGQEPQ